MQNRKKKKYKKLIHIKMTKGEQIIGKFNNENRNDVDFIKEKAIELVNLIEEKGIEPRRKSISITQIELGVMMAVKSLFP